MTSRKLTKKRAALLAELEHIVGSNCWNGNTQNWGPGGTYSGAGRSFRYPLQMVGENETIRKTRSQVTSSDFDYIATGHYAFGANSLHIIDALDKVLHHLEQRYGFKA